MSVVTNLKLGIRDLLDGPPARPRAIPPLRAAPVRSFDRQIPGATDRRAASCRQHHCRGSAQQPRRDARLSADHRSRYLLYVRERRTGPWSARGGRCRTGTSRAKVIALLGDGSTMYSIQGCGRGAIEAAGGVHHRQQLELPGARGIRPSLRHRYPARREPAGPGFLRDSRKRKASRRCVTRCADLDGALRRCSRRHPMLLEVRVK